MEDVVDVIGTTVTRDSGITPRWKEASNIDRLAADGTTGSLKISKGWSAGSSTSGLTSSSSVESLSADVSSSCAVVRVV